MCRLEASLQVKIEYSEEKNQGFTDTTNIAMKKRSCFASCNFFYLIFKVGTVQVDQINLDLKLK